MKVRNNLDWWFSKHGFWTSSISTTWELVKSANSEDLLWTFRIRNFGSRTQQSVICQSSILKFENHWSRPSFQPLRSLHHSRSDRSSSIQVIPVSHSPIRAWHPGWGKNRFTVVSTWKFILVLLFINYCIIFHRNCEPIFAPPYIADI